MCEFCIKHGEGKKWYLSSQNYSKHLIEKNPDLLKQTLKILDEFPEKPPSGMSFAEKLLRVPLLGRVVARIFTRKMKRLHFGQVVPLRDVSAILDVADTITLFPCVCRGLTMNAGDERYCFGLGIFPREIADEIPFYRDKWQAVEKREALELISEFAKSGLVQTVWTLGTPFIVGLCNCRLGECLALNYTVGLRAKMLFKSEYVVSIDPEKCVGCKRCMEVCNFGALVYHEREKRCIINHEKCFGCGLCVLACEVGAVGIRPREGTELSPKRF